MLKANDDRGNDKTASKKEKNEMMENIGKVILVGSFTVSILFFLLVQYAAIFNQWLVAWGMMMIEAFKQAKKGKFFCELIYREWDKD